MSFIHKVAIVTGGSAGIGAATVVQFARQGAKVVIVGRNEEKLNKVAEKCKEFNADYHVVKADITKENNVSNVIEQTIKKYGKLDILINNAGILRYSSVFDEQLTKVYDEIMNTNLKSIVILTSLAAPYLIKTKGNIVNISSVAGAKVLPIGFTIYSTSKAAVNMFTMGSALEMASHGVRVNSVSPGPVKTDIFQEYGSDVSIEDFKSQTVLQRISDPDEVADLILFLASDKAKGITGANYICDNGFNIKV